MAGPNPLPNPLSFADAAAVMQAVQNVADGLVFRAVQYYGNDMMQNPAIYRFVGNIVSGTVVLYLTKDGTPTGDPIFKNVLQPTVNPRVNDAASQYLYGWAFTNGGKTLTITVNKQTIVLGLLNFTTAANGVPVTVIVSGEAA